MTNKVRDDACGDVYLSEARELSVGSIKPENPNPSSWYSRERAGREMKERIGKYGLRREDPSQAYEPQ